MWQSSENVPISKKTDCMKQHISNCTVGHINIQKCIWQGQHKGDQQVLICTEIRQ